MDYLSYAIGMKICLAFLMLSIASLGQSMSAEFEKQHARDSEQNPDGIRLTIATADGRSEYHLSDELRFKLFFTSNKLRLYTVELSKGNTAGTSDDFVIQTPDMPVPLRSKEDGPVFGIVCCASDRHYIRQAPTVATSTPFSLTSFRRPPDLILPGPSMPHTKLPPGTYAIFLQTRRVLRGWPKSERDKYFAVSNLVVTSNNILHITVLPDPAAGVTDAK